VAGEDGERRSFKWIEHRKNIGAIGGAVQLKTHRWGQEEPESVVCVHGLAQHGRVFEPLGRQLSELGHSVAAVDLRGHGGSAANPPWNVDTHVEDVLEALDRAGIERVSCLVGHSFGGRVAAAVAARAEDRVAKVALLDPGLQIPAERALRSAEVERRDWSFATIEGGVRALLSNDATVAPSEEAVRAFAEDDMREGPDGRLRFGFSPSAVVVAWSEMVLPPPPIAARPTLFVQPATPLTDSSAQLERYRDSLGEQLTLVEVPNGHNVLWESPVETLGAIADFIGSG
jgi:lipase